VNTMLFSGIGLLDENFNCQTEMFVGVKDGIIAYIGAEKPAEDFGEIYPGSGKVLMPGVYNSHTHASMTLLRGYAENLALADWLEKKVFPFEKKMTLGDVANGALLAIAEMLRFGTVSFSDMYYYDDEFMRIIGETGIKANFSYGVTCFDERGYKQLPAYGISEKMIDQFHNAFGGRMKIDLSIHGEYTSTPCVVEGLAAHAKSRGVRVHTHLSETKKEHEECKQRRGKTPAAYFASLGLFDSPATAAHCVWLEDDDMDLLRGYGVTAASCPVSNLKLAGGFARVPQMLERGVRVALGTDGAASNNNLNLFKEIHCFATLFKCSSGDPSAVTPAQALAAATFNGAQAQGRENGGVIKAGAAADLIVLDTDAPHMHPVHQMANNLVFAAQGSDVLLTMVDGEVLYDRGDYKTLDIERVLYNADRAAKSVLSRLS